MLDFDKSKALVETTLDVLETLKHVSAWVQDKLNADHSDIDGKELKVKIGKMWQMLFSTTRLVEQFKQQVAVSLKHEQSILPTLIEGASSRLPDWGDIKILPVDTDQLK